MTGLHEGPVQALVDELGRLPGVGPKSAQRIAYHILKTPAEDARRRAERAETIAATAAALSEFQRHRGIEQQFSALCG